MSDLINAANGIGGGSTTTFSVKEFVQYLYDKKLDPVQGIGERGLSLHINVVGQTDAICGTILAGDLTEDYIAIDEGRTVKLVKQSNITSIAITSDCVRYGENADNRRAFM